MEIILVIYYIEYTTWQYYSWHKWPIALFGQLHMSNKRGYERRRKIWRV